MQYNSLQNDFQKKNRTHIRTVNCTHNMERGMNWWRGGRTIILQLCSPSVDGKENVKVNNRINNAISKVILMNMTNTI